MKETYNWEFVLKSFSFEGDLLPRMHKMFKFCQVEFPDKYKNAPNLQVLMGTDSF